MRKSTRIVKRIFALLLVVLMSIESFAAVVSDNDGSAFITKAEFDSLKNDFQSQIDQYNTSIDSKIDGAIASYLAGVRVAATSQWVSPYKVKDFIFWGDEFVTCIPKITSTYFTFFENSSNNLTVSGPWNGSITLHTEQDATDQTGYIVGTSDGTRFFMDEITDPFVLNGAYFARKRGTNTTEKNSLLAKESASLVLCLNCTVDEDGTQYVRGRTNKMRDVSFGAGINCIDPTLHAVHNNGVGPDVTWYGLNYQRWYRYDASGTALCDADNHFSTSDVLSCVWNKMPRKTEPQPKQSVSQHANLKFFVIDVYQNEINSFFDGLEPSVKDMQFTWDASMQLTSCMDYTTETTNSQVQKRLLVTSEQPPWSYYGIYRTNRSDSEEGRSLYTNFKGNWLIVPKSGYLSANDIIQSVKYDGNDVSLANGILLSDKAESDKLVITLDCNSEGVGDIVKIMASNIPFQDGISTTHALLINGSTTPTELSQGTENRLVIETEKNSPCFIMVSSQLNKNVALTITNGVWELS